MKKSGKHTSNELNSNIAITSLPTLHISLGLVALFEKIYDVEPILTTFSTIGEDAIPSFQWSVWCMGMMWKVRRSPTLCRYWETIVDFKWQKQGSLSSFRPLSGWGLHRFVWKISAWKAERETYRMIPLSTHLFSHWSKPLNCFKMFKLLYLQSNS